MVRRSTIAALAVAAVLLAASSVIAAPLDVEVCSEIGECPKALDPLPECGISEEGVFMTFDDSCHREAWSKCMGTYYVLAYDGAC